MREWIYGVGRPKGNEDIYIAGYERHISQVISSEREKLPWSKNFWYHKLNRQAKELLRGSTEFIPLLEIVDLASRWNAMF